MSVSSWQPRILRPDERASIDRGNGARTTPLVTRAIGATSFLNGVTSFAPSAVIAHHSHNCVESVMVIEGTAIVDIDGVRTPLTRHDTTFVPANVPHHFENASDSEPMAIFWTYASADATRRLEEADGPSGPSRRVDVEADAAPDLHGCRETARIRVLPGTEDAFEAAVAAAVPLFQRAAGCRSLQLRRGVEEPDVYLLCIEWDSIADHLERFRASGEYVQWRERVGGFFAEAPQVVHDRPVLQGF
ncbi:hypothetical protein GCM10022240_08080 [Microbacterium kribbense]|uniref:ABM domain-containing protein n=1 Tax=Microbacterium kribbense TaxID=433645 RepID=A0ABP7GB44_9MICO